MSPKGLLLKFSCFQENVSRRKRDKTAMSGLTKQAVLSYMTKKETQTIDGGGGGVLANFHRFAE